MSKANISEAETPAIALDMRGPYSPRREVLTTNDAPSLTKQAEAEACDINNIMAKYQQTGLVDHVNKHGASYGDLDGKTFTENMQTIAAAQSMFEELPSAARAHFEHDPAKFLDFVDNIETDADISTMVDLGLLTRAPTQPTGVTEDLTEAPTEPPPTPDGD